MRDPEIIPIRAAELELPATHPEGPGTCEVFAFLVRDVDATFLIDTGVGEGVAAIDTAYRPRRINLLEALSDHGMEPKALSGIVNSHLHFDHCGNNNLFPGVPIFVQRAEYEAAAAAHYTVPSWLHFDGAAYEMIRGRHRVSRHVELIPTPGHTPGHQSALVETTHGTHLVVAQAAYTSAEFGSFDTPQAVARDDAWSSDSYADSLRMLHALRPLRAFFSHDPRSWSRPA